MKIFSLFLSLLLSLFLIQMANAQHNTLTDDEIEEGWKLLFDGQSLEHWRVYNSDEMADEGWVAENGEMIFYPPQAEEWSSGLDIITRETYSDFILKLEWSVERAGNSGIFYHVLEQPTEAIYWSGLEMQILDNENHPDADQGVDGNRKAGSLYDLIPADPQNTKPYDEWNSVKIVSNGPRVEHWQNGEKVLEYERWTVEWFEMLRNSKFVAHPEFGAMREGHIGLQDHGDVVRFRNIKIKEL
ncbi:MAG: DUF1080 domain-containing protein [Balneolaceae bacterium]|nr:DUF1080 domain-containing protein [Balneolaceae bacterium]